MPRPTSSGTARAGLGSWRARRCRSRPGCRSWRSSSRWPTARAASTPPVALARKLGGSQFDPNLAARFSSAARDILDGLDAAEHVGRGDRRRPGARTRRCVARSSTNALGAVADFVDLKSPYMLGSCPRRGSSWSRSPASGWGSAARAAGDASPGGPRPRVGPARCVQRHLGQAGSVGSGRVGAGAPPALPHGANAAAGARAPCDRCRRRAAARAPGRLRLSAWPGRRRDLAVGSRPGRGRRVSGDA